MGFFSDDYVKKKKNNLTGCSDILLKHLILQEASLAERDLKQAKYMWSS